MSGRKRNEQNRLMVKIKNPLMENVFGEPFIINIMETDGTVQREHASVARAIRSFLRTTNAQGQNVVIKNLDDSRRAQVLGLCLQAADEFIEMPIGDHKWLISKVKEFGHLAFPTDASYFLDLLEDGTKEMDKAQTEEAKEGAE